MITHVRVDERLIHGQVASVWVNFLGCNRILVANDAAVKDEFQIAALKMACPAGVKLSILSVNRAVENILGGKYNEDKVFLITRNIADCKAMIERGVPIGQFNVGNLAHREGQRKIKNSVSLSDADIADLRQLLAQGIRVKAQMVPNEPDVGIETFL